MQKLDLSELQGSTISSGNTKKDYMLISMKENRSIINGLKTNFIVIDVELVQHYFNFIVADCKTEGCEMRIYNDRAMKALNYHLTKKKGKRLVIPDDINAFKKVFINDVFVKEQSLEPVDEMANILAQVPAVTAKVTAPAKATAKAPKLNTDEVK